MQALTLAAGPGIAAGPAGLRLFQIEGDCYEPQLRGRDMLMVAPAGGFHYDGEYLLDFGGGEAPFRAASCFNGQVEVWHPNPKYSRHRVTTAEFGQAVRAIVVAEIKVKDERMIRETYGAPVSV